MSTRTAPRPVIDVCSPGQRVPRVSIRSLLHRVGGTRQHTVAVHGEIDASNARRFADAVVELATAPVRRTPDMTLDMTEVTFLAVEGLTALHAINAAMVRADIEWQLAPSAAVDRVLAVCHLSGLLKVVRRNAWAVSQPA